MESNLPVIDLINLNYSVKQKKAFIRFKCCFSASHLKLKYRNFVEVSKRVRSHFEDLSCFYKVTHQTRPRAVNPCRAARVCES